MAIIALSGKKQAGKNLTVAYMQYLILNDKLNKINLELLSISKDFMLHADIMSRWPTEYRTRETGWEEKAFAEKLKKIVCLILDCTIEQLEDNDFKEKELGEEWIKYGLIGRAIHNGKTIETKHHEYFTTMEEADKKAKYLRPSIPRRSSTWYYPTKIHLTPRKLLQYIGTEGWREIIHPNIWVNSLMGDYKSINQSAEGRFTTMPDENYSAEGYRENFISTDYKHNEDYDGPIERYLVYPNWFITDLRFPNEVKAVKDRGGIIFRIINSRTKKFDSHVSETALDDYKDFDGIIHNEGSKEELLIQCEKLLKQFNIIS